MDDLYILLSSLAAIGLSSFAIVLVLVRDTLFRRDILVEIESMKKDLSAKIDSGSLAPTPIRRELDMLVQAGRGKGQRAKKLRERLSA